MESIGLALGGAAGARLIQKLGYPFSRDTLLRCLAKMPLPAVGEPRQLGVDDFAFRKGRRYGTIVVDLERGRPLALLEDGEAKTLADWLKQYPGIEILSRDRSKTYRSGMNEGAPGAVQVADRFHLLQNLVEPLEKVFGSHRKVLKEIEGANAPEDESAIVLPPAKSSRTESEKHRERWRKRYRKVMTLHRQGWSAPAIGHRVGLSARTVRRYLAHEEMPERESRSDLGRSRALEPYKRELLERWNAGCYEAKAQKC